MLSCVTGFALTIVFAVFIVTDPIVSAQPDDDGLGPFLGTWSGIFTTQDNEFWGVEDMVCFAGCSPEAHSHMRSLLDDPANDDRPVNALLGESWGFEAEHIVPILTGEGRLDGQTAYGKTVAGVARIAAECGVPVLVVAGSLGPGWERILPLVEGVEPVVGATATLEDSLARPAALLAVTTERALRGWLRLREIARAD